MKGDGELGFLAHPTPPGALDLPAAASEEAQAMAAAVRAFMEADPLAQPE